MNSDFNYKHYTQFYDKMEGAEGEEEGGEEKREEEEKKEEEGETGYEDNVMWQLWEKAKVEESFYPNYEKWLEEEVWSYYD